MLAWMKRFFQLPVWRNRVEAKDGGVLDSTANREMSQRNQGLLLEVPSNAEGCTVHMRYWPRDLP
jgi:hypothetical protein